jgi:hypothetical protein
MKTNLAVVRCGWRRWLRIGAISLLSVTAAHAADVSGVYADAGTPLSHASAASSEVPSLYAWLRLEFDPKVVSVLRDQTGRVVLNHSGDVIDANVYDNDGALSWSKQWREGVDFVQRGGRVLLSSRGPQFGNDEIVLTLERLPENELLQVTVQRVSPTTLGPAARKIGSALFHQLL